MTHLARAGQQLLERGTTMLYDTTYDTPCDTTYDTL